LISEYAYKVSNWG